MRGCFLVSVETEWKVTTVDVGSAGQCVLLGRLWALSENKHNKYMLDLNPIWVNLIIHTKFAANILTKSFFRTLFPLHLRHLLKAIDTGDTHGWRWNKKKFFCSSVSVCVVVAWSLGKGVFFLLLLLCQVFLVVIEENLIFQLFSSMIFASVVSWDFAGHSISQVIRPSLIRVGRECIQYVQSK